MFQRNCSFALTLVVSVFVMSVLLSEAAPAFKFKKILRANAPRAERRLVGQASPIHFITPFLGAPQPMHSYNNFFAPQASLGNPSSSSVFKLPLRLYANGKPNAIFHGLPKPQNVIEFLPQAMSNIIRLPLKYISNAKPVGVYFKDPTFNYL